MEWHVNDLSLAGQFANPLAFRAALEPILRLRSQRQDLRRRIFCSRLLSQRLVTHELNVEKAIWATPDPLYKRLALEWFANGGPFWDDERATNPNDYFEFEGQDVTNEGLGEVARRCLDEIPAESLSFPNVVFERTPLLVQHGLPEEPLGEVEIGNVWNVADLDARDVQRAGSWKEVVETARARLDLLIFSEEIPAQLQPNPFHAGIAERMLQLLQCLQMLARETREDSSLTPAGMALLQSQFAGKKAAFTDESEGNKQDFETEMTFRDPANPSRKLFCPWHGKVKQGPFRIHFEWKRPAGQREIKVLYIGPKITKR